MVPQFAPSEIASICRATSSASLPKTVAKGEFDGAQEPVVAAKPIHETPADAPALNPQPMAARNPMTKMRRINFSIAFESLNEKRFIRPRISISIGPRLMEANHK